MIDRIDLDDRAARASPAQAAGRLPDSTSLAVDRTRLAHERTLMAWVRTATSMISFGFTIYKFFQGGPGAPVRVGMTRPLLDPRTFATIMIAVALVALLLASVDHHREMRALRARYGEMPPSTSLALAWLVAGLGILTFTAVILRA
jgi:inner membrane protein YidH